MFDENNEYFLWCYVIIFVIFIFLTITWIEIRENGYVLVITNFD